MSHYSWLGKRHRIKRAASGVFCHNETLSTTISGTRPFLGSSRPSFPYIAVYFMIMSIHMIVECHMNIQRAIVRSGQ
ncbi:hypothetical protein KCU67_g24, partial [Aureobasidium melanogenum]